METALVQMQRDFAAEEILLTAEQRKERKESINQQEKKLIDFRQDKFGTEGALFKKRAQLVKPIQDKMFEAVQAVAKAQGLDYIFDKASGVQMLYANPRYDKTFEVMEELGIPLTENESKKKINNTHEKHHSRNFTPFIWNVYRFRTVKNRVRKHPSNYRYLAC